MLFRSPNVVALLSETAPKNYRGTFVMAAFIGYSSGNALMGQAAAWLIPLYGWQVVFLLAGIAGSVLSLVLAFLLTESIPFLAAKNSGSPRLRALVSRMAPEVPSDSPLVYRRPAKEARFALSLLFDGVRRFSTPLIWIAFFA